MPFRRRTENAIYARQVSMLLHPGKRAELVRRFTADIIPLLRTQAGFVDKFVFVNPVGDDVLAVSLWDNKEDVDAYCRRVYPDVYGMLAVLLRSAPRVKHYEVANSTCHTIATRFYAVS